MLKVAKFGGSSMADAKQFEGARHRARRPAAGDRRVRRRQAQRRTTTSSDLLYLCYAHLQCSVSCDAIFR